METIRNGEKPVKGDGVKSAEYKPKIKFYNDKYDKIQDKERESADLEFVYKTALLNLREKFPTIPEDLTNKCVTIRYKQDNGIYQNIFLYSDHLVVDKINEKNIVITKFEGKFHGSAGSTIYDHPGGITHNPERFSLLEFEMGIDKIIENADKCEITVEELNHPKA